MVSDTQVAEIGIVPAHWKVSALGEFTTKVTYGFTNPMPDAAEGPFKVTAKDINDGRILYDTARRTTQHAFDNDLTEKSRPSIGDVLLTKDGSIGRVAIVDRDGICINQSVAVLQPKQCINSKFLKYLLLSPYYQRAMANDADGTTIKHIYITRVDKMEVAVPPLPEQKAIAHILGTLDHKIELNRQTNKTLESIARAIFKSWFVDFDPVRAKRDGKTADLSLSPEILDLFPDSFQDSELGDIPAGWEIQALSKIITITHGFAFKGKNFSDTPTSDILLTPGNFKAGGGFKADKLKYHTGPIPEDYLLRASDLVVTMTDLSKAGDTLGYPAFVPNIRDLQFLHNQRIGRIYFQKNAAKAPEFVFHILCTPEYRDEVLATATGSTVRHTSPTRICDYRISLPSEDLISVFDKMASDFRKLMNARIAESDTLSELRDTLLPKLISGELRIKDAEKFLKDAPL